MNTNELSFDELNKVAGGLTKQPFIPPTPRRPFDPHPLPYPVRH